MAELSYPYLEMKQNTKRILLTKIPAGVLTNISYAAVRGKNDEAGAVQRILNSRRIDSNEDSPQQATGYQKEDNPEPARSKLRGIAPKEIKRRQILYEHCLT